MRQPIYRSIILALALLVAMGRLHAQSQEEPLTPKDPLLPRAPEMAAWTVTYTYKSPKPATGAAKTPAAGATAAAAPPAYVPERLASLAVVKTGTIYHLTSTYSMGRINESWIIGGRELTQMPGIPLFLRVSAGLRYDDFTNSDFEELSWLSEKYYTGVKKRGAQSIFTFSADNTQRPLTPQEKMQFDMSTAVAPPVGASLEQAKALVKKAQVAYMAFTYGNTTSTVQLDAATQLPVEWDDGKIDRLYSFAAAPTDKLVPPPEVAAEFKKWAQQAGGR